MDTPYRVYGGLQDNNSWGGPSQVRSRLGIANADWFVIGGGDGFVAVADPKDSRVLYTESQDGRMNRIDRHTNERAVIRPEPAKGEPPLRWNWNTPLVLSPHDSSTVYVAANRLFRSTDRGQSWTAVSPDLTAAVDRETLSLMGVVAKEFSIAKHDGVGAYGTLVAFAESPKQAGLYFTGADDGTVHVSRDGGKTWENISGRFPGLPKGTYVSRITPSSHDANVVYATFDGHRGNDFGTYVYASRDQGRSWTAITNGITRGHTVHVVTEDPRNADVLYAGTEFGLFVSVDRGATWRRWKANLPTVPINGIVVQPRDNDLILATHGRSIWILDDLTPVQQLASASAKEFTLFDVRPAVFFNPANDRTEVGDRRFWGKNPPPGAAITYLLKDAQDDVAVRIKDGSGTVVREIKGDAMKDARHAGVNRVAWDLRYEPAPAPRFQQGGGGGGFFGAMAGGPMVLPGTYQASLVVKGKEVASRPVTVAGDALIEITDADRRMHHETVMALNELQRTAVRAADAVYSLTAQLDDVRKLAGPAAEKNEAMKASIEDVSKKLGELRRQLGVPVPGQPAGGGFGGFGGMQNTRNVVTFLRGQVMASTSRPTETQLRQMRDAREDLAKIVEQVNGVIGDSMPRLLAALGGALQPAVRERIPTAPAQ
jgi:hypothetical protein